MKIIAVDEVDYYPLFKNGKLEIKAVYRSILHAELYRSQPKSLKYFQSEEYHDDKQMLLELLQWQMDSLNK